jgi:alpha-ribazole phosphatase
LGGPAFRRIDRRSALPQFIKSPAKTVLPGGETISDVQRRGLNVINEAAQKVPGGRFLLVSHGDVIRAVLCHYMKLPLNQYRRLRIDNGSLSALQTDRRWAEIKYVNYFDEIYLGQ